MKKIDDISNREIIKLNIFKNEYHLRRPLPSHLRFARKIKDISYNQENNALTIVFASNVVKTYCNVPETLYQELIHSNDPSEIFLNKIDAKFTVI